MISSNLIIVIVFLSLILLILVFLYINNRKKNAKHKELKSSKTSQSARKTIPPTFELLKRIIKDNKTSMLELEDAITDLMQYYGEIPPKRGLTPDKMFSEYATLLIAVCRHKNTNTKIVVKFDKQLREKNPLYASNIDEMLQRGLNSR